MKPWYTNNSLFTSYTTVTPHSNLRSDIFHLCDVTHLIYQHIKSLRVLSPVYAVWLVSAPTPSTATPSMNQSATNTTWSLTLASNSSSALYGSAISARSALSTFDSATSTQQTDSISCPPCPQQLPTFQPMNTHVFSWGIHNAEDFFHAGPGSYLLRGSTLEKKQIKVPTGKAGKEFTHELFLAFVSASSMESVALRAAILLPILLLRHIVGQKQRSVSRIWKEGNLNNLTLEGGTIQSRLPKFNQSTAKQNLSWSFANLMFLRAKQRQP